MHVLQKTLAALIILNTLGTALAVPLIYLDFNLRKEYISNVLCIKKDKPMTICGGRCYLTSQLKKVEDYDQKTSTSSAQQSFVLSFFFSKSEVQVPADKWVAISKGETPYFEKQSKVQFRLISPPPQFV